MTCKQLVKGISGDEWTLGDMNGVSAEDFWTWVKKDITGYDRNTYLANDKWVDFDMELCF